MYGLETTIYERGPRGEVFEISWMILTELTIANFTAFLISLRFRKYSAEARVCSAKWSPMLGSKNPQNNIQCSKRLSENAPFLFKTNKQNKKTLETDEVKHL